MKKVSVFCVLAVLMPMSVFADDVNEKDLVLNVRRIGLDWSKTNVRHSEQYLDSPVQVLSADSQDFFKGVFDTVLEYEKDRFNWDNSWFMEYGKTTLKPANGPRTINENADKILLSSDLSYACWDYDAFKFGPMARASYETEFKPADNMDRYKVARGFGGLSLFDHKIFKKLYIAGLYEYDFTNQYSHVSRYGAELGWRLEYLVKTGVNFSTDGYYREYFDYSEYVATDFERDLSVTARMDTNLWSEFTMGPYVQYRRAKARGAESYGSNLILGVSFNYITKFGLK